jgi:hypothetical protein
VKFRSYWEDLAALICVAGVSLIRNDAILLLVPMACVLWLRWGRKGARGASLGYMAILLAGFVLANLPMPLIDHVVIGKAFPPGAGGTLYLTNLSDLTADGAPVTLHTMLAHGATSLVKLRVATLPQMLYRMVWVMVGFGAIFVPILALRRSDGSKASLPELAGGLSFLATIAGVYGLVIPAVGGFSALRSFSGLLPLTAVLIVAGIGWVSRESAPARVLVAGVFMFYLLMGIMGNRRGVEEMDQAGDAVRAVGAALAAEGVAPGGDAVVMTDDAAQFSETTAVTDLKPVRVVMSDAEYEELRSQLPLVPAEHVAGAGVVILKW